MTVVKNTNTYLIAGKPRPPIALETSGALTPIKIAKPNWD
jgi:hypothetical protein